MDEQKVFQLADFEADDTAVLQIRDSTGALIVVDGKPFTITLYGPGSTQYIKAQAKLDSMQAARTIAMMRGKPLKDTPEDTRLQQAEKLTACTHSIQNFPIEPLALYTNPKLGYITEQVSKFVEDWVNFTGGSAKS